jgi:16S rRNA (guanine527-N7)-methyltransferase
VSGSQPLQPPRDFIEQAASLGIEFDADDLARLARYLELLLDANTRFNLTAITDPAEAWRRHILDSLTLLPLIESAREAREGGEPMRVIDVGSGGGLPGMALACVMPDVRFTLLEATGKKAKFLQEAAHALGLSNVDVVIDRAETVGQDHRVHRARYDVVLSRAVGPLPVLLELTVPLAKVGGTVLAIKGERAAQEAADAKAALHLLHAAVVELRPTPTGTVIVIDKPRATPRLYPRAPGEPKRRPLGGSGGGAEARH